MSSARPPETGRTLKRRLREWLASADMDAALAQVAAVPDRRAVNPLLSLLYDPDPQVKWAAVAAMGDVLSRLADRDAEGARVVMRRLMWNLNDESGGMGWGSPEAMGEILARHGTLAEEYAPILISYARKDGNYLEHEGLQRGLMWAIGRLAEVRPHLLEGAVRHLLPYLDAADGSVRGLAARALGLLRAPGAREGIERLTEDRTRVEFMEQRRIRQCLVKDLVAEGLAKIAGGNGVCGSS